MARRLIDVEHDVRAWIAASSSAFAPRYVDGNGQMWVLKFFPPQYLAGFIRKPELVISTTAGFTWGDGVYLVPLDHVYSAMIYGRVGVMGWIGQSDLARIYDASVARGSSLYEEWIQFKPALFRLLTTTVHSQFANRRLRNAFRSAFNIDLVIFKPDEFNRAYVLPARDRWVVLSDFAVSNALAAGTIGFSSKVRDCEVIAIGTEEFVLSKNGFVRQDQLGPYLSPVAARAAGARPSLGTALTGVYQQNRRRGANPPQFFVPKP